MAVTEFVESYYLSDDVVNRRHAEGLAAERGIGMTATDRPQDDFPQVAPPIVIFDGDHLPHGLREMLFGAVWSLVAGGSRVGIHTYDATDRRFSKVRKITGVVVRPTLTEVFAEILPVPAIVPAKTGTND